MKLYLIRHTAVDVPQGVCYGQSDVWLKPSFAKEAALVLRQLRNIAFDKVFTSPLSRCRKLANYCGYKQAIVDSRLQEINFGAWEMQYWDKITDPNLQNFYNDWLRVAATGGESFQDLYKRFSHFMADLAASDLSTSDLNTSDLNNVAVFTHGGIINCARVYAGVTTPETMFADAPSYGSITELVVPTIH